MKKNYIINPIIFTFLICLAQFSKSQSLNWANTIEASSALCKHVKTDSKGNVYAVGYFLNTQDFDPGPSVYNMSSGSGFDGFIIKSNKDGNFIWAKQIEARVDCRVVALEIDENDNMYLIGIFSDSIDLDPGPAKVKVRTKGVNDVYITKLDPDGNFIWGKTFGGSSQDYVHGLAVSSGGDIYTSGEFTGTVDFNPGSGVFNLTTTGSTSDVYILKLNKNGDFVWAKKIGNSGSETANSLCIDRKQNILVTGGFGGTVDFDPGTGTANLSAIASNDLYILKLDSHGIYRWARSLGTTSFTNDFGNEIVTDDTGNVYTCGSLKGAMDFDPGPGVDSRSISSSQGLLFIHKLDSNGIYHKWVFLVDTKGYNLSNSMAIDKNNSLYITGTFGGDSIDFDPGPGKSIKFASSSAGNIYVLKIKQDRTFEWVSTFGGKKSDQGSSIHVDKYKNVYVQGSFQDTVDFGTGKKFTKFTYGYFWLKLSQCAYYKTTNVSACRQYKYNNVVYKQSGDYNYKTVSLSGGCDSVYILSVIITPETNPIVSQNKNTLSANFLGATYQWIDCGSGGKAITGKTNLDFTPAATGSYAVVVIKDNCSDTSACFNFIYTGIKKIGKEEFRVVPNPGTGLVMMTGLPVIKELSIFDYTGRQIYHGKAPESGILDLTNLSKGVYYIKVGGDGALYTTRFIRD
jgi:hypothetical protein